MRWPHAGILFLTAFSASALDFWDSKPAPELAEALVQALTVREQASQCLMLAFPESEPDALIRDWVSGEGLGGIKFFGWNASSPESVTRAVAVLQADSQRSRFHIPLLVATDQEGGWVRHIKGTTSSTPGNLALGASGLPHDAWKTGELLGAELRQMGINMNFAPSVDLYTNPDSTVIGPRSFSQDPVQAGVLGSALFQGLRSQGVIATAKHFPGHGNTPDDSHGRLPVLDDDLDTLRSRELVPYRMMIGEGLRAIMSGHLSFPRIISDGLPASLSPVFIRELLRKDLNFDGVVITDDLLMEGARPAGLEISQAAVKALEAGNDLLLISKPASSQREARDLLVNRARADAAFAAQLRAAARRVLLLKLEMLKGPQAVPLIPQVNALRLPAAGAAEFFFQSTARAAVLLAGTDLPWSSAGGLLCVTPYEGAVTALSLRFPTVQKFTYEYQFSGFDPATRDELVRRAPGASRIVFVLAVPGGVAYLKALEPWASKVAVISLLSPVLLRQTPWVRNAVAVFGTNAASFEVATGILAGDWRPRATLPVRFGSFPGAP